MVYVICAVAACLGIGVGIGIGYLLWVRPSLMSLEEMHRLEDRQLLLIDQQRGAPSAATEAELARVTRLLDSAKRRSDAQWERRTRAQRRELRREVARDLD